MNYKEKIEYAETVLNEFCKGKSEETTIELLESKKLSKNDITAVLFSSKNLFFDKYGSSILSEMDSEGNLVLIDELVKTDEEWCQKFYEYTNHKLEQHQTNLLKRAIKENKAVDEIQEKTNQNYITKEEINNKLKAYKTSEKNRKVGGAISLVLGIGLLSWFLFGFFTTGGYILLLIPGVGLIYRGISSLNTTSDVK